MKSNLQKLLKTLEKKGYEIVEYKSKIKNPKDLTKTPYEKITLTLIKSI